MLVDLPTYTLIHVVLSVVGVIAGLVVVGGLMAGMRFSRWVGLFLATTVLTNVTGFCFPFVTLLPSHIAGALSLLVLPVAIAAQRTWLPRHRAFGVDEPAVGSGLLTFDVRPWLAGLHT
jgi:hypothetical protein